MLLIFQLSVEGFYAVGRDCNVTSKRPSLPRGRQSHNYHNLLLGALEVAVGFHIGPTHNVTLNICMGMWL
jgi:hypothetical protein